MIDWLAAALADAIAAAAAASGLPEPFFIQVGPPIPGGSPLLPPVVLVDESWRRRAVSRFAEDGEALRSLPEALQSGAAKELDTLASLREDARLVCAGLALAVADPGQTEMAERLLPWLADALTMELDMPDRFPAADYGVVPVVRLAGESLEDGLARARRVLGDDHAEDVEHRVRSQAPPIVPPEGLPERALRDRDALSELLRVHGLGAHAHRLAHDVAEVALLLRDGEGRSHLGGPPRLPPGASWPLGPDGRPLTFLAAIDCAELPARAGWPGDGWWLFFGQLDEGEDGEFLYGEEPNGDGSRARLLRVAKEPVAADGPHLRPRPVRFDPVLTLPGGWGEEPGLGFDTGLASPYSHVLSALRDAIGEPPGFGSEHWIGGHVTDAQGDPPGDAGDLLLHLSWDEELGLEYADGGTIQFRLPADALARGEYESVVVYGSSS